MKSHFIHYRESVLTRVIMENSCKLYISRVVTISELSKRRLSSKLMIEVF